MTNDIPPIDILQRTEEFIEHLENTVKSDKDGAKDFVENIDTYDEAQLTWMDDEVTQALEHMKRQGLKINDLLAMSANQLASLQQRAQEKLNDLRKETKEDTDSTEEG